MTGRAADEPEGRRHRRSGAERRRERRDRRGQPAYLKMLAGILLSYALIIGAGDTAIGDVLRVGLFGYLLWIGLRLRGWGRLGWVALAVTAAVVASTGLTAAVGSARLASGVAGAGTLLLITAVIITIVEAIVAIGRVDTPTVLGVLCVYLLLALAYSSVHQIFGAFITPYLNGTSSPPSVSDLLYFSVITMTTVGFGDITPASEVARAVTVTEALTGQLYLVSVVAGVVSSWQGRAHDRHPDEPNG